MEHIPVLVEKILEYFIIEKEGWYVDCTVGAGGHSFKILEKSTPDAEGIPWDGRVIAIDRDQEALNISMENLAKFSDRVLFINGNFRKLKEILEKIEIKEVNACLFDLGVSSVQLSSTKRGFSFKFPAPLDMRMDESEKIKASDLVNNLSRIELEKILIEYGEERYSNRIVKGIIRTRQKKEIKTTTELVDIILSSIPKFARYNTRIHPATRTFQALRIAVNDELNCLREGIGNAIDVLKKGGRIFVISFHSLEDRIVKKSFKFYEIEKKLKILTKKPLIPDSYEINLNIRARSAKLRIGERI